MSWGHASSPDLYHWTTHGIVLHASPEHGSIYSGSIVVDSENTSGLFGPNADNNLTAPAGVVAVYTQHFTNPRKEQQAIAPSYDGGLTFNENFEANPVLQVESGAFRDPKVIWYEGTRSWVMVVAHPYNQTLEFFSSKNLIDWRSESLLSLDIPELSFECPNFAPVPYLKDPNDIQTQDESVDNLPDISPESGDVNEPYVLILGNNMGKVPKGWSSSRYFPGVFNGTHFTPFDDRADRMLDFGPDNYAGQFFFDASAPGYTPFSSQSPFTYAYHDKSGSKSPSKHGKQSKSTIAKPPIYVGWTSNWAYAKDLPTGPREEWRGAMTLPRAVGLASRPGLGGSQDTWELVSVPVGLENLTHRAIGQWEGRGDGNISIPLPRNIGGALVLDVNITVVQPAAPEVEAHWVRPDSASGKADVVFNVGSSVTGENLAFGFSLAQRHSAIFWADRGAILGGWENEAVLPRMETEIGSMPMPHTGIDTGKGWNLKAVLDRSILEVFLNGGVRAGTLSYFPKEMLDQIKLSISGTDGRVRVHMKIMEVDSVWSNST